MQDDGDREVGGMVSLNQHWQKNALAIAGS
jgi:hypothetical protein